MGASVLSGVSAPLNIIIASIFNMVLLDHDHKLTQCLTLSLTDFSANLNSAD